LLSLTEGTQMLRKVNELHAKIDQIHADELAH
jgi:hypothetical protein